MLQMLPANNRDKNIEILALRLRLRLPKMSSMQIRNVIDGATG
ncbi:hypothetical protein [Streptomyces sp. NBC_00483]